MPMQWIALLALVAISTMASATSALLAPAAQERSPDMISTAVGFRTLAVEDRIQGKSIPLLVFYPASGEPQPLRFGPFEIQAARDAAVGGDKLPLIILSHGSGGTPWTLRDLAMDLARSGFVAILPEHVGDSLSDSSLFGTAENLRNRPRHIRLAADAALDDAALRPHLRADRIGAVGLSMGGYSILAAAGGKPWTGPQESKGAPFSPVKVEADERLSALVLLAPATAWFRPQGSLGGVHVPVMMRTGALDTVTPAFHADLVRRDIAPSLLDDQIVPNAGHFSFMSSFPPEMKQSGFAPSQDPPGFDRDGFRPTLHKEIIGFLRQALLSS